MHKNKLTQPFPLETPVFELGLQCRTHEPCLFSHCNRVIGKSTDGQYYFYLFSCDQGIEKNYIYVEFHKDIRSLAEGPEQLVIRIKESRE